MTSADLAIIDPAQAKAFEIRRFAIGVRERLPHIESLDTLSELHATMLACKHRLTSLHEEVVQANRTHLLIMQRVGQLLGSREPNPGESYLRTRNSATYRARARLIAAHPDIVTQALNQPTVSVTAVLRRIYQYKAALAEHELNKRMPAMLDVMRVKVGDWWRVGNHLAYCGSFHAAEFITARDKAEPSLTYVDTYQQPLWNHHWFRDFSPAYAFTDTASFQTGLPDWLSLGGRHLVSFVVERTIGDVDGLICLPTVLHDHRGLHPVRSNLIRDVVRLMPKPNSPHDGHKPMSLVTRVLEWMTDEGETVCDPNMGEYGLTLQACEATGRKFIGSEFNPVSLAVAIIRSGLPAERVS